MPRQETRRSVSRRNFLELAAAATLTLAGIVCVAGSWSRPAQAQASSNLSDAVKAQQALPDVVHGKADAPVTVVEYASMTCSHCAAFHKMTYPTLISKYVDTGKVRFILREFPLDPLATAAFMLARCSGPEKRNAVIDLLFDHQADWAFTDKPLEALANLMKQTGMTQASFETCINDQSLYDKVTQERAYAAEKLAVNSTPTFFINGTPVRGALSPDALSKLLDPLVKK